MMNARNPSLHTARTLALTQGDLEQEVTDHTPAWGTMDQAPARKARPQNPKSRWVEAGILLAAVAMVGTVTLTAGALGVGFATYAYFNSTPSTSMGSILVPSTGHPPAPARQVVRTPQGPSASPSSSAPAALDSIATQPERPVVQRDELESEMTVQELRRYMEERSAALANNTIQTTATTPEPTRTSPYPPVRSQPAAAAPVAPRSPTYASVSGTPDSTGDAELDAILADDDGFGDLPGPAVAPGAPLAGTASAPAPASAGRSVTMPNGVIVLDQPLDPVPVAIRADGDAAIYVDGELLGASPMAVVLERGSHTVTVTGEKGTTAFDLQADDAGAWCFNVRKDPKLTQCR